MSKSPSSSKVGVAVLTLVLVACASSADRSETATDPVSAKPEPACGLVLSGPRWGSACEAALDRTCCEEKRRCAENADCAALIACVQACSPRTDECIEACAGDAGADVPGYRELDAIGTCSKRPSEGAATGCSWPN